MSSSRQALPQVLVINPKAQLIFDGSSSEPSTAPVKLSNPSTKWVAFKIETTGSTGHLSPRPKSGIIRPGDAVNIVVFYVPISGSDKVQVSATGRVTVQATVVTNDQVQRTKVTASKDSVMESIIDCFFRPSGRDFVNASTKNGQFQNEDTDADDSSTVSSVTSGDTKILSVTSEFSLLDDLRNEVESDTESDCSDFTFCIGDDNRSQIKVDDARTNSDGSEFSVISHSGVSSDGRKRQSKVKELANPLAAVGTSTNSSALLPPSHPSAQSLPNSIKRPQGSNANKAQANPDAAQDIPRSPRHEGTEKAFRNNLQSNPKSNPRIPLYSARHQDGRSSRPDRNSTGSILSSQNITKSRRTGFQTPMEQAPLPNSIQARGSVEENKPLDPSYISIDEDNTITLIKRVPIPTTKYPSVNFIGKLIGSKGKVVQDLESKTSSKIKIEGRGSYKDKTQEEKDRNSGDPQYAHLNEELHVRIEITASPVEAQNRLANVLSELEKFLDPNHPEHLAGNIPLHASSSSKVSNSVPSQNIPQSRKTGFQTPMEQAPLPNSMLARQARVSVEENKPLDPSYISIDEDMTTLIKKVYIPTTQHPNVNFIGKLIGPQGKVLKDLEIKTHSKISIMGRGSRGSRDKDKEERERNSGDPKYAHLNEELHVHIKITASPVEAQNRLANVLSELEKFLDPNHPEHLQAGNISLPASSSSKVPNSVPSNPRHHFPGPARGTNQLPPVRAHVPRNLHPPQIPGTERLENATLTARAVTAVRKSEESPLSPKQRYVSELLDPSSDLSALLEHGTPNIRAVGLEQTFIDEDCKLRKYVVGKQPLATGTEKVILVVGATGAGKTTLINSMLNYFFNVQWEDKDRFKFIVEKGEATNQATSMTKWVSTYTSYVKFDSPCFYTLTVIDTPGFGDTKGSSSDDEITAQIDKLFNMKGKHAIDHIDAVCIVVKSALTQLTTIQRYIFHCVFKIFGKDIEDNIFIVCTSCKGERPEVLAAVECAKLPYHQWFRFNNFTLYEDNSNDPGGHIKFYWDMNRNSMADLFKILNKIKPKSVDLSREVLQEGNHLPIAVDDLQPQINEHLSQMEGIRQRYVSELLDPSSDLSALLEHGTPNIRAVGLEQTFIDEDCKLRKYVVGKQPLATGTEKVILVVGATGAGKTTLINSMLNYFFNVQWEDKDRFKFIVEKGEATNQATSMTKWVSTYTSYVKFDSPCFYTLTVIDTPGFGDTKGSSSDDEITAQIDKLFNMKGKHAIDHIDAVCIVVQSSQCRLTPTQSHIFNCVLQSFGNDMKDNVFILCTFADRKRPEALAAVKSADIPCHQWFPFNNSALYEDNSNDPGSHSKLYWDMNRNSMANFFKTLNQIKPISLHLTREVLQERDRLQAAVNGLQPQINEGLAKMEEIRQLQAKVEQHQTKINANGNFRIQIEVPYATKVDLQPGVYVTNCLQCNRTCHYPCSIPEDSNKKDCAAMKNGTCTVCPGLCPWDKHVNNEFRYEHGVRREERTLNEVKEAYDFAYGEKVKTTHLLERMDQHLEQETQKVAEIIFIIKNCLARLDEIALRPNAMSTTEYIDLLIQAEQEEKRPGYPKRIEALIEARKKAKLIQLARNENPTSFQAADPQAKQGWAKNIWSKLHG